MRETDSQTWAAPKREATHIGAKLWIYRGFIFESRPSLGDANRRTWQVTHVPVGCLIPVKPCANQRSQLMSILDRILDGTPMGIVEIKALLVQVKEVLFEAEHEVRPETRSRCEELRMTRIPFVENELKSRPYTLSVPPGEPVNMSIKPV